MYYYILESPSSRAIRQNYQRLRDLLTNFGIAGEMVTASPARTPAELTNMGISKGYSTIVAVGSDAHINQIATSLLGRAVLGIIPIGASDEIVELIGSADIKGAAESLKQRKISLQPTLFIEPDTLVFLDGVIETQQLCKITIVCDNKVRIHAYFNKLRVNRNLEIDLESTHTTEVKRFLGIFGPTAQSVTSRSHFHGKNVRIVTDPPLKLTVAGEAVATAPLQLRYVPESLKLITKRGTVLE
jgi:diacylglycerol kinase family enzyme